MALAQTIPIPTAIQDLSKQIAGVRRKTSTLIDYYIYPDSTPSQIGAYEPRLAALDLRLATLNKITYTNLAYLLDDSDALASSYLLEIVDQLLNGVHGIQELFCNHYDRNLEKRKPFNTIYQILLFRETQLKDIMQFQMTDTRRLKAEELRDNQVGGFCRGAISMINERDRGTIAYVQPRDLLNENRERLERYGGTYIWWQCPDCDFRLRYHVSTSAHGSIRSTQEVREHVGVKAEYKSAWLVKSHLYQPPRRASGGRSPAPPKYGCVFCFAYDTKDKGIPSFYTGRELAEHVASVHKGKNLPAPLMLQKFNVAVKGKCAEQVRRWDINLT